MDFYTEIFKNLRESRKFTLDEIAQKVGVSKTTVHYWDTGRNAPRPAQVYKLAKLLGCSVYDISDLAPLPDDPALQPIVEDNSGVIERFRQGVMSALIDSPLNGEALKIALQIVKNYEVK